MNTIAKPSTWANDQSEILAVGKTLVAAGHFTTAADMLAYLEKPWRWSAERHAWIKAGRPDSSAPGWDRFCAELD